MDIKDVERANALVRKRDGLLFLIAATDYTGVSLMRHREAIQPIEQWFSDIKETMIEAARSELGAVELDLKNLGVEIPMR